MYTVWDWCNRSVGDVFARQTWETGLDHQNLEPRKKKQQQKTAWTGKFIVRSQENRNEQKKIVHIG